MKMIVSISYIQFLRPHTVCDLLFFINSKRKYESRMIFIFAITFLYFIFFKFKINNWILHKDYYYLIINFYLKNYLKFKNNKDLCHHTLRVNRIDIVVLSTRCHFFHGSLTRRNKEVKGAKDAVVWAWVTHTSTP
jgi:hypothetical protein